MLNITDPDLKFRIIKYKRYLDRGGIYFGYYSMIAVSLILIKIFNIQEWYFYVLFILIIFITRFFAGFLDERYVLKKEQQQYAEQNPVIMDMNKKLDEIIRKLNNENKN